MYIVYWFVVIDITLLNLLLTMMMQCFSLYSTDCL